MRNSDMLAAIKDAFRRVPRLGKGWRYVPLHRLPIGTEVIFDCKPYQAEEPATVNGAPETHITPLAEGKYKLFIGIWPAVLLDRYRGTVLQVKPYSHLLAPSAPLIANFDRDSTTFRLTTGPVKSILVPGTPYRMSDQDKERQRIKRPRRSGAGYQPLRNKW